MLCGGTCKPIAGSHAAEPMGWISSYLDRRPLPRHGGGGRGGGRCASGYFWSVSVRSTDDASHRSYPALQATERGSSRGNLSPLTRFCLLLAVQKEAPAGQAYQPSPSGDSAPPPGDHQSALNSHNKSQPHLPSKIHHLCKLDPTFTHFVNLP